MKTSTHSRYSISHLPPHFPSSMVFSVHSSEPLMAASRFTHIHTARASDFASKPYWNDVDLRLVKMHVFNLRDPKKKQKELADWEADLKKREQEIKRREDAFTRAGVTIEEKNWPPFFPIIHHDIAKEIPVHAQKLQYMAFASWLGIVLCLVYNVVAVTVCWIRGGGVIIFLLANIYAFLGIPLSYLLWYRPLYHAMRTDSVLKFGFFFLLYMIHICFCIVASIAPPIVFHGKSLT
ncbi:Secretory carrier-associated membrane protein 4 [Platanthera guangdongensis]|uniref:Secretory carrier-associated membrane protein n=1 Tax=Platanthera guangdongensis TaxID=2320717 RepID=A0ABR2N1H9_9ASPA